jgi:hypothetical protein
MTPAEINEIGLARYGTSRFIAAMSEETRIPYRTLYRYSKEGTDKKLAVEAIKALMPAAKSTKEGTTP